MKKRFITLTLLAVLVLLITAAGAQPLMKVFVNNVRVPGYPHMQEGVAYFAANPLARALGVSISWNPTQRIVKVNNKVVTTTPLMMQGVLYLPLETIAGASGATMEWKGDKNAIMITKPGGNPGSSGLPPQGKTVANAAKTPKPAPTLTMPKTGMTHASNKSNTGGIYVPKPPATYTGQPSKSAYPDNASINRKAPLQPKDAPPRMPANLSMPNMAQQGKVGDAGNVYKSTGKFAPRTESNDLFQVTVTNTEFVDAIKDYYKPKPGFKFYIVYLSQQNVSDEVQVYTGRFSLLDTENHSYDYIEGLSNFWLVILRPQGVNFGYLVFEIPDDATPDKLALHGLNKAPLAVGLR